MAASRIRFQIVARTSPAAATTRLVEVKALYARTSGERVVIADHVEAATGATQQIPLTVDLSSCLADDAREGDHTACPLRVIVALRDSLATAALDSSELGPFATGAGKTPQLPAVDLVSDRLGAREWMGDSPLILGGQVNLSGVFRGLVSGGSVSGLTVTGLVTGSGTPLLFSAVLDAATGRPAIGVFQNGVWHNLVSNLITADRFTRPAVLSQNEIWIGAYSGLYRYDGTAFNAIGAVRDSINSVSVLSTGGTGRLIIAVGQNGIVWQGDGSAWRRADLGSNESLNDVCVTAPNEAFIAGDAGTIWRYDGTSWIVTPTPITGIKTDLECPKAGQAFAIAGGTSSGLLRWTGSAWVTMPAPAGSTGRIFDWAVVSPSEIYAESIAGDELFYQYDGTNWRQLGTFIFGQGTRTRMWADPRGGAAYSARSFGRMEAVGTSSGASLLSYTPAVRDLVVTSPTSAFVVGWNLFLARWNGQTWTVDRPPTSIGSVRILQGVWSDGPNNAWTAGGGGEIVHWDGTSWTVLSDVSRPIVTPIDSYYAIWGQGSTVIITGNSVLRCTSTTRCTNDTAPVNGILYGVWGTALDNVYAVGAGGQILHYNGLAWSTMSSPTTRTLARVWGTSASDIYAVGDSILVHYNGTTWSNVPMTGDLAPLRSPVPSPLQQVHQLGLWGTGPKDIYLGGEAGRIAHFDGSAWHLMPTSTTRRILAISGVAGFGALGLGDTQSAFGTGPSLLRGIGPSGGFTSPMSSSKPWP